MASLCDLTIITTAIQEFAFSTAIETDTDELWQLVNRILTQLQHWHDHLPALLGVRGQTVPHVLLLR
jgi:hypothetical protein